MGYKINLRGQRFGKLIVIEYAFTKSRKSFWICKCDCGNIKNVESYKLRSGHTKSCGCIAKENMKLFKQKSTKHNMTNTKIYRAWQNMKNRCYNINVQSYKNYGGRGIMICDEWKNNFMNFYNWAINNGYKENLTIDRIDNDGNYEPSNCRWVDRKTQANNKTNNHFLTYNNKTLTINQWANEIGISRETIKSRIKNNFPTEKILSQENFNKKRREAKICQS